MISICEWDKKCKQRFAYTMWWILRALWLVVAHDLLEYRHLDDVTGNAFPFFVENGARFWECLRDYLVLIRIRQVKSAKNVEHELLTEKKNEKIETKRVLDDLKLIGRCLTWQSHGWRDGNLLYLSYTILKMFARLLRIKASKDLEKKLAVLVYK